MAKSLAWFKNHPWSITLAQTSLIVLGFGLLVLSLIKNLNTLQNYRWSIRPELALLGLILLLSGLTLLPLMYQRILKGFGFTFNYLQVYEGFFIVHLSKYIPGSVWVVPGRAVSFQQLGVDVMTTSASFLLELFVLLFSGVLVFLPYFFYTHLMTFNPLVFIILTLGLLVTLILLPTDPSKHLISWGLRKFGYRPDNLNISPKVIVSVLVIDVIYWLIIGSGFFLLSASLYSPLSWKMVFALIAVFSMSWVAGVVTFLTPSGLGVREGVMALLLTPFMPAPFPAIIALAARLWWIIGDLLIFGSALLLKSRRKPHQSDK